MTQWAYRSGTTDSSVLVVGNLNVDLMLQGIASAPRWGQEVLAEDHELVTSGQAGYLAMALGALGDRVTVIGTVGDDAWGRQVTADLARLGADTRHVLAAPGGRTGLTVALVRPDGERAFVSDLGASRDLRRHHIDDASDTAGPVGVAAFVGLFNTPGVSFDDMRALLARARARGAATVFDPGWDPDGWSPVTSAAVLDLLHDVEVFLPNQDEAEALTGHRDPEAALATLARHCPGTVVVKCGPNGAVGRCPTGHLVHAPAAAVPAVANAVGAGDAFDAGLIHGLLRDEDLPTAMATASIVAGYYVSRVRHRFATVDDIAAMSDRIAHPTTASQERNPS